MSINLKSETRAAIHSKIVDFIESVKVQSNSILDATDGTQILIEAEEELPKSGPRRDSLSRFVGEYSLLVFVSDRLRAKIADRKFDPSVSKMPYLEAVSGTNSSNLADEIINDLDGLPWKYRATFWLPKGLSEFVRQLEGTQSLGKHVRLTKNDEELSRTATKPNVGLGLLSLIGAEIGSAVQQAAIQFEIEGFVARFSETETAHDTHGFLKSVLGLGIAIELFTVGDQPAWAEQGRLSLQFGQDDDDGYKAVMALPLGQAESVAIQSLTYNPSSPSDLLVGATGKLKVLGQLLNEHEQHPALLRASRWLFESHVGEDVLLNFVQAMIVLEILLGDKATSDEIGLGTLLANRCAYMIGGTTSERARILSDFKAIYAVRSQIVHAGKLKLSWHDRAQLMRLRWLGRRVIREEIKLAVEEMARREKK